MRALVVLALQADAAAQVVILWKLAHPGWSLRPAARATREEG